MRQLKKAVCCICWFILLFRCVYSQRYKKKSKLDELVERQQQCFPNALKCILLLNEWGSVGCAQCGENKISGSLKILDTQDSVTEMKGGEFKNDIIMATESFAFSPKGVLETLNRRASASRAIIVAQHTKFWNDKDKNTNQNINNSTTAASGDPEIPYPPIRLYSADKKVPNEDYLFSNNVSNPSIPHGTGLIYGRWPVNMFYISDADAQTIRDVHRDIQNRSEDGGNGKKRTAPIFTIESFGEMQACPVAQTPTPEPSPGVIVSRGANEEANSNQCLKDNTCLPIGGYSVWSSMSPINETTFNTSETREIVAVTAPMDSAALFHDMAFGAAAEVASVAALMAVVKSVGDYGRTTLTPLKRHPMYFAFNAQSWGFSGSGRFLEDVNSFECKQGNNTDGFCNNPISPSMKFKQLKDANFSVINLGGLVTQDDKIVDKQPVTKVPAFFMHGFERGNENGTRGLVEAMLINQFRRANLNISDGFRNGSFMDASQSFQRYAPNADVVTLTNFKSNFTNRYYHSLFDNATLFKEERPFLYEAARAVAHTVIELVFGDSKADVALEGDLIDDVIECLTTNWNQKNCSLAQEYLGDDYLPIYKSVISSNYAGVFVPPDFAAEKNANGYGKSMFLQRFMAYHTRLGPDGVIKNNNRDSIFKSTKCSNVTQCQRVDGAKSWAPSNFKSSFCAKGACVSAESHLHAAFGTGLTPINAARSAFNVEEPVTPPPSPSPPSPAVRSDPVQPAWTESTWGNDLRLCYRIEDTPLFGGAILGSGLATFVICLIIAFFLNPSRASFKGDSDDLHGHQPIPDVQP